MSLTGTQTSGAVLVPGAHRVIRALDRGEGPYAGLLVNTGASVAVQVSAEELSGWAGWEHAGSEHVAGPLDVVRRADGHDVLLPWCTERGAAFLGRRAAIETPLLAGEVTTLVASLLRGVGELGCEEARRESGEWWLTEDGRPMFVLGEGDDPRVGAVMLVDRLQRECTDRALARLLGVVSDGLRTSLERQGMPGRQLDRWESELFEIAAPRPLAREAHAPERARDVDVARRVAEAPPARRGRARGSGPRSSADQTTMTARVFDAIVSVPEHARSFLDGLVQHRADAPRWRSMRRARAGRPSSQEGAKPTARRGRRVLVAGAAAAFVLGVGLLWPGGATGEQTGDRDTGAANNGSREEALRAERERGADAAARPPSPSASAEASPPREQTMVTEDATSRGPGTADPVTSARTLFISIEQCAQQSDTVCTLAVADGSSGIVEDLATWGPAGQIEVALVDEYGDVAVVRAGLPAANGDGERTRTGEKMVVLVRQAEKWLVRDAYDVADQPG